MKLRVYNDTLDPNIWNADKTIKPDIREHLLKIAEDFYNSTELQGEIHDILFIGSSANYNWTPSSDIDVHIVIDIAEEKINEDYARKFMDALGGKWNLEHDVEIKGHPVEIYLQDIREPNSNASLSRPGAAIYSLFSGKWIQEPEHKKPDFDADKIRKKFQTIQAKAKKLIETDDIDTLKDLMKSIKNYRNTGLAKGGEFSNENLVFKALRKSGILGDIKDTINKIYDKQSSLPENGNMQSSTSTPKMNENLGRYLIVGWINEHLEVIAEKDEQGVLTHDEVMAKHPEFDAGHSIHSIIPWRYKSTTNTLHWYQDVSDKIRHVVVEYLKEKFGINNPKEQNTRDLSGHKIDEKL